MPTLGRGVVRIGQRLETALRRDRRRLIRRLERSTQSDGRNPSVSLGADSPPLHRGANKET